MMARPLAILLEHTLEGDRIGRRLSQNEE